MYTRQKPHITPVHVPENYSGNAFKRGDDMPPLPYSDLPDRRATGDTFESSDVSPDVSSSSIDITEAEPTCNGDTSLMKKLSDSADSSNVSDVSVPVSQDSKSASPLSFFSGKEDDILIFAIIFILIKGGCDDIMIILLLLFLL